MAWTGLGAGTELDPWQIDTKARLDEAIANNVGGVFMKLMNDIDHTGLTGWEAILKGNIKGTFDGDGFGLINLGSGSSYDDGYRLWNGAAVKNIKFHYTRKLSSTYQAYCFYDAGDTLTSVTLQNIHAIAEGDTKGTAFVGTLNLQAGCTVSDIIIEGNFRKGFLGNQYCNLSNIKFYRLLPFQANDYAAPQLFSAPAALVYRCQVVVPDFSSNGSIDITGGLLAGTIGAGTIIRQCIVLANINVTQLSPTATNNPFHVLYNYVNSAAGSIAEDNLILGNYFVNGGGASVSAGNAGKNIFALGASITTIQRRNVFNGDISNSYYNNRPPMSKAGITSYQQIDLFYNTDAIVSMTATPETGKQTGLTAAQMAVQSNFTGFDFSTVWQMNSINPELINNQLTGYALPLKNVGVQSVSRVNSAGFGLVLSAFAVTTYGVDILEGETIILNSENTLTPTFTGLTSDKLLTIKPYYYEGAVKTYTGNTIAYQHYFVDIAAAAAVVIDETSKITLNTPSNASRVHGSIYFDGYIYGVTRNITAPTSDGYLVKAPTGNISAVTQIPILVSDPVQGTGSARYSANMEQIVECGGKLYALFSNTSLGTDYAGEWIMEYDPVVSDYKVRQLQGIQAIAPIATDGIFLYISAARKIIKISPAAIFDTLDKYRPNYNIPNGSAVMLYSLATAIYDEDTQGGAVDYSYSFDYKGILHSAAADGEYLYLAYATPYSGFVSGYDPATNKTYNELHKVRISDMSAAGWCYIPQTTDDMSQTATHLFLGIEVQPTANVAAMGYGWGSIALRKSDLRVTSLPRLHANDNPPTVSASYGSLIFGEYLIDLRNNAYIVVLDISDVDNWAISENVGARTVAVFQTRYGGTILLTPINDLVSDPTGNLYGFYWTVPSLLSQFTPPGISIFAAPTLDAVGSTVTETETTLTAHVLLDGGQSITSKGFRYGRATGVYDTTVTSTEAGATFHAVLTGLEGGLVYYQAFATNPQGTTYSAELTFTAPDLLKIYYNGQHFKKAYLGATQLIYK
jgi:hypothetical protein